MTNKYFFSLFFFLFMMATNSNAQKGLYIKFSLGPGYTSEVSSIHGDGISFGTKNHAIGWGITDDFAIQIGEFGSLIKQKVGEYNYINTDAFGLGFSYRTPIDLKVAMNFTYAEVHFAYKGTDQLGDYKGNGYGMNLSVDKEWLLGNKWGVRIGPQFYWMEFKKSNYRFLNASVNGSVVFYLSSNAIAEK